MRKIAVIGSGTSGMVFAHKMLSAGYDITVYSDRTPEQWLNESAPTGTAFIYDVNIQYERDLGIEHWGDTTYNAHGIHLDWQPTQGAERIVAGGLFASDRGGAVDIRMRVNRWMTDFEAAGRNIVYGVVTPELLDQISTAHDLTVLAVGKGDLARVIPRDPRRSVYDKPQRNLAMLICEGIEHPAADRADFVPVKFNFYADAGEYFWVPYTHKDIGRAWCVLFEPKPGSYLDQFGDCKNADDIAEVGRGIIKTYAPYEWENVKNMRPVSGDAHCWLKGRFPPTVRMGSGRAPSGGLVIPIGDVAILFDPIGGQGGNCAVKNTHYVAERIIEHATAVFDEEWAEDVRDCFWDAHGRAAYAFNNILLEPLTEAGIIVIKAASQSFEFGSEQFFGNIDKPNNFFPWMEDAEAAKAKAAPYMHAK